MGPADVVAATIAVLPIAVVAMDQAGVVVAANPAAEQILGVPLVAATGRRFSDLPLPRAVEGLATAVERAVRDEARGEPFEAIAAGGGSLTCRLARVRHETFTTLLLTAEDRSAAQALASQVQRLEDELRATRIEMESTQVALRAANDELQDANAELQNRLGQLRDAAEARHHKDDFLAMLAHELRNPLAPILAAMKIIRRHPADEEVVQRAREVVERQVRHQAQLLDDLLDVSRVTRGRITLRKTVVDVRTAVAAAVETARPVIDARRHTLTVALPDAPLRVDADPTRLTQIVSNLLDNAAKYTDPGGAIEVVAGREGGRAVIRVRDTGIGIPPEMQSRVFELFTQGDVPLARSLGGLGLGLTLVRSLAELHGGSAEVASEGPGRGSTFTIRLPEAQIEAAAGTPAASPSLARHVLVIDDNADAREMLRMALQLDGHRVETAVDGISGVELAMRTTPDLVLVDIGLPRLDGYGVARRLRGALGDRVTLVALTGYGQSEDRQRAYEAGFDAHLVKPVDPDVLARALATGFRTAA